MDPLLQRLPSAEQDKLKAAEFPEWISPMLATLSHDPFSASDWIYERKLDGERCLLFADQGEIRLLSRNRKSLNDTYPELEQALSELANLQMVADGEIVAFEGDVTSFARLQQRMQLQSREEARESGVHVYFYLFDCLYLGNFDLRELPLRRRKEILREAFDYEDPVRYTAHRNREGEAFLREACRKGWEGLIAKDAGSSYVSTRSRKWLKFKCRNQQELVIGGYTDPEGEREGFGAILVGYFEDDEFLYAGKVGTGFDEETLQRLREKFEQLSRNTSPFDSGEPDSEAHWIRPELVAEIKFTEWTRDGKLRHPAYLGLRHDKDPKEVTRES